MTVTAIAGGVYTIQFDRARVFVIEDRPAGTTTLADVAFPGDDRELVSVLESKFGGVNRLVITHGDEGHFGGAPAVLDAFNLELLVPSDAKGLYDTLGTEANRRFRYDDMLNGGIRIMQVPGHMVANNGLLLKDDGASIAGDVVEGSDRRGPPPGFLAPPAAQFNDLSREEAERNLVKLFDYDIEMMPASHSTYVDDDPFGKLDDWLIDRQWTLSY